MNIKHHFLKRITALLSVVITTIFGSGPINALLPETPTSPEKTLEERLAEVRQKLQQQQDDQPDENSELLSSEDNPEVNNDETLVSQWYNWQNWPNNWNQWRDWPNWGNWRNYY